MSLPDAPADPLEVELRPLPWYGYIAVAVSAMLFVFALYLSQDGLVAPLAAVLFIEAVFLAAALWPARLLGGVIISWLAIGLTALLLLAAALFLLASGGTGFLVSVAVVESLIVAAVSVLLVIQLVVVLKRVRGTKRG